MQTDPVSDYLTRLRNALAAQHEEVQIPTSKLKKELSRILKEQGYINDFEVAKQGVGEVLTLKLKYTEDRSPVIQGIKRVSRPGRRRYVTHEQVPRVQGGMGTAIISSSTGVMTGHDARRNGVGGEVVAFVW